MYSNIMVPVSLSHTDRISKALKVAANLAQHYGATVHYVAVTTNVPSEIAQNAAEFSDKFQQFVNSQAAEYSIKTQAHTLISTDTAADLDAVLEHAEETIGADLVVIASHMPGFADRLFTSHGRHVAAHSKISVLVVR